MSDIINDYEIRVFAMQRSGHHAVMEWVLGHFEGPVCFINDFSRLRDMKKQAVYRNISEGDAKADRLGKFIKKECLLVNFEEEYLRTIDKKISQHTNYPRGISERTLNVLILRDPHNLFASRLKMARNANSNRERWIGKKAVNLWLQHANEFMGKTSILPEGTIMINYNEWFSNEEYRRSLSENFELEFTDKNKLVVPRYGGGSSFDKLSKKGAATDMRVLERWKAFSDNKKYNKIFKDNPKLNKLSDEIFGSIR